MDVCMAEDKSTSHNQTITNLFTHINQAKNKFTTFAS